MLWSASMQNQWCVNNFLMTAMLIVLCGNLQAINKKPFITWKVEPLQISNMPDASVVTFQSDAIFVPHSAQFQPHAASYLIKALRIIKQADTQLHIFISAYCDDIPNAVERQKMTTAQAESVASYLWSQGVPYERMVIHGMGSKRMLGNVHYVETNALNRRVEVVLAPALVPQQIYPFKE